MKAIRLKTEYLTEPLGLGITALRFYWNCEGGKKQSAYQIVCKRSDEVVWDSGKVLSSSMTHIPYGGKTLASRDRVNWSVKLWDENDVSDELAESWFELGLLENTDWKASWITGDYKPKKRSATAWIASGSSLKRLRRSSRHGCMLPHGVFTM